MQRKSSIRLFAKLMTDILTALAASRAEEANDFACPRIAGEFEEVLRGGVDVEVIYRHSDQEAGGIGDLRASFLHSRITVGAVTVADRQAEGAEIEQLCGGPAGLQSRQRRAGKLAAATRGMVAATNDEKLHAVRRKAIAARSSGSGSPRPREWISLMVWFRKSSAETASFGSHAPRWSGVK